MRRSICYCEPQVALAGQVGTWTFKYQTAAALPKGTRLKFDLVNYGREGDWELPSVDPKGGDNVIFGVIEEKTVVPATEVDAPTSFVPQYEFTLPSALKVGEVFTVVMGIPIKAKKSAKGTRAQTMVERRKPFNLYVDPKGKGEYDLPETFSMDIRGNRLETIRILTPSLVVRNKRFDVTIRFEDAYGNLTANAPEETLIDLSYNNLRENLNWKLFVPETGFVTLPNLYFNEPGVYRLRLEDLHAKVVYISSPIKCLMDSPHTIYWGQLHGESERYDSGESIEAFLRYGRDDRNLNFIATSPFECEEETTPDLWKDLGTNVANFNEDDRFAALLGFQWKGESPTEGLRHIVYSKENKPVFYYKELKYNLLSKIYRSTKPTEVLSIPSFTMGKGFGYDFKNFEPEFERVVEIYNAWGSSECTEAEGNLRPISCAGTKGVKEWADGSIQKALANNCRFGFVAGGLDDRGIYAGFLEGTQNQYSPGLTAILSAKQTRDGLLDALARRACYATTGARIIMGFQLISAPMGAVLSLKDKPGLSVNRHLHGYIAGTTKIERLEVVRNGTVIADLANGTDIIEFEYDDMDDLAKAAFPEKGEKPPFVYYYLRIIQEDGEMAWSSPIWIDLDNGNGKKSKKS